MEACVISTSGATSNGSEVPDEARKTSRPQSIARWNWESTTSKRRQVAGLRLDRAQAVPGKLIVQTKVTPFADQGIPRSEHLDGRPAAGPRGIAFAAGINNQELLDWSLGENGCLAAAPAAKGRPLPARRFLHPRHHGYHPESYRERQIRLRHLHQLRRPTNWSAVAAAARGGRVHHQPQR